VIAFRTGRILLDVTAIDLLFKPNILLDEFLISTSALLEIVEFICGGVLSFVVRVIGLLDSIECAHQYFIIILYKMLRCKRKYRNYVKYFLWTIFWELLFYMVLKLV
jgi:hypothetical protein